MINFISADDIDNPTMGDAYYNKESGCVLVWHNNNWIPIMMSDNRDRKKELLEEFESNPELFDDVFNELRKRKIQKLKK